MHRVQIEEEGPTERATLVGIWVPGGPSPWGGPVRGVGDRAAVLGRRCGKLDRRPTGQEPLSALQLVRLGEAADQVLGITQFEPPGTSSRSAVSGSQPFGSQWQQLLIPKRQQQQQQQSYLVITWGARSYGCPPG